MKHRVTDGYPVVLLLFVEILKSKTGGSRPARRLTFVHAATKVSKNAFLLTEGISFARFLRHLTTSEFNKPAGYRGPSLQCDLKVKSKKHHKLCNPPQKERLSRASGPAGDM